MVDNNTYSRTRYPWTQDRMEWILNELITKNKKYKSFTTLVDIYVALAERIGATPRIVQNFIKNLGRDHKEMLRINPELNRDTAKLRGSNKVFRLYEEYCLLYCENNKSDNAIDQFDVDGLGEGSDDCDVIEVKYEHDLSSESPQIISVVSMSATERNDSGQKSPPPPSPPQPSMRQKSICRRSFNPATSHTVVTSKPVGFNVVQSVGTSTVAQVHTQSRSIPMGGMPPLASLHQNPHQSMSSQAQRTPHSAAGGGTYLATGSRNHMNSSGSYFAASGTAPAKRPLNSQPEPTQQPSTKRSCKSSIPMVSENLPADGMTEFERRYLQGVDTQNKMLSDIARELRLLRTGFFAIHSDEIADMVNPNAH